MDSSYNLYKRFAGAAVVFFFLTMTAFSQEPLVCEPAPNIEIGLDRGLRFNAPDSSIGFQLGFRLQSQLYSTTSLEHKNHRTVANQSRMMLRRARLMVKGYLLREQFTYFANLQFDKGETQISDFIVRWHLNDVHTFGVGQFRVFDDRQFRISSAYLQFVERSFVSNIFTEGYDIGAFWNGHWVAADRLGFKWYGSVTHGEGANQPTDSGGFLYTGRVEVLPLGKFAGNSDYRGGVLTNQVDPKLSIGLAATLNRDAHLFEGQYSAERTDIRGLFADIIFKYRNFSAFGEWAWREVERGIVNTGDQQIFAAEYSGTGAFLELGNRIAPKIELHARVETLRPEFETVVAQSYYKQLDRYGLGATYYICGYNLKIQADLALVDQLNRSADQHERYLESRVQFQLNF